MEGFNWHFGLKVPFIPHSDGCGRIRCMHYISQANVKDVFTKTFLGQNEDWHKTTRKKPRVRFRRPWRHAWITFRWAAPPQTLTRKKHSVNLKRILSRTISQARPGESVRHHRRSISSASVRLDKQQVVILLPAMLRTRQRQDASRYLLARRQEQRIRRVSL